MKSTTAIEQELKRLEVDLKYWRERLSRLGASRTDVARRQMAGNTIVGIESQIEALQWVLDGE